MYQGALKKADTDTIVCTFIIYAIISSFSLSLPCNSETKLKKKIEINNNRKDKDNH